MKGYRTIPLSLALCAALFGCTPPPQSGECKEFFSMPAGRREKEFRTYSLDRQLAVSRCGMARLPPETVYAAYIAERGESAVEPLAERLEGERDELTQVSIINVFEMMAVKGHLRGRRDVVERIRQVAGRMKFSAFREMAQESLTRIERNMDNN